MATNASDAVDTGAALLVQNRALLLALRALITRLTPREYRLISAGGAGSIGTQTRHLLDCVEAFTEACASTARVPTISYSARRRGAPEEQAPALALDRIDTLLLALATVPPGALTLAAEITLSEHSLLPVPADTAASSVLRELAFVSSHSTHHLAIIRLLVTQLGHDTHPDLGVAPATQRFRAPTQRLEP